MMDRDQSLRQTNLLMHLHCREFYLLENYTILNCELTIK